MTSDLTVQAGGELGGAPGAVGLYLAGLAPGSRRSQLWRLERAAVLLGHVGVMRWEQLEYWQAVEIRARAAEAYAPRTASAIVAAVRAVCREAWRGGLMDGEAYRRIQSLPPVKGSSPPPGRWVSRAELRELFAICDDGPAGRRDVAILALLFGAGLRRGELVALEVADLEIGAVVVREGKGRKSRRVALGSVVVEAVAPWAAELEAGPLLRQVDKGGNVKAAGLTGEAIRRRLVVLCKRAGVEVFRPHDARRSYASGLLDAGADLCVVARLLGHSGVSQTASYDRRGARAETAAAGMVLLPLGVRAPGAPERDPHLRSSPAPLKEPGEEAAPLSSPVAGGAALGSDPGLEVEETPAE